MRNVSSPQEENPLTAVTVIFDTHISAAYCKTEMNPEKSDGDQKKEVKMVDISTCFSG